MEHDLPDPILETARSRFGVDYLYPYQRLVVANTIDANAASEMTRQIVVLPTGSGKTLCFSLPAVMLDRPTVVVYPLLALMTDQLRRASSAGIAAAVLKGGMSADERRGMLDALARGELRLLITNPEMLAVPSVRTRLAGSGLAHLVVDEAHCVSEWGETFRPSYLELGPAIREIAPRIATAFTATASSPVLESIRRHLFGDDPAALINGNPDRPNISYTVLQTRSRSYALRRLLSGAEQLERPAIVFCSSRSSTEALARGALGYARLDEVGAYHAGVPKDERTKIEEWFFGSDTGLLFATCAYGMGVDKANVRSVIHYDEPASVEAFLQESGRAGRDGRASESVLLVEDRVATGARSPASGDPRRALMHGYATTTGCRREYLLSCMGGEAQSCFGCDRCRSDAPLAATAAVTAGEAEAVRALISFVAANRRRLFESDILRDELHHRGELEEFLASMFRRRELRKHRYGPWKARLCV